MAYEIMHARFPELIEKETRTVTIFPGNEYNLPPDEYGLLEMYCNDEDCDCRRVILNVTMRSIMKPAAFIAYGWEDLEYYVKWFYRKDMDISKLSRFDREKIEEFKGPCLNDFSPQSKWAPALLKLIAKEALTDEQYVERLKRHYKLFRAEIDKEYKEKA